MGIICPPGFQWNFVVDDNLFRISTRVLHQCMKMRLWHRFFCSPFVKQLNMLQKELFKHCLLCTLGYVSHLNEWSEPTLSWFFFSFFLSLAAERILFPAGGAFLHRTCPEIAQWSCRDSRTTRCLSKIYWGKAQTKTQPGVQTHSQPLWSSRCVLSLNVWIYNCRCVWNCKWVFFLFCAQPAPEST